MNTLCLLRYFLWTYVVLISVLLLGCGGCASQENPEKETQGTIWKLSPNAQGTYAYLLYDQSLRHEDEEGLLEAMNALRVFNPPASVYIESAVWLMGRKSPAAQSVIEQGLTAFKDNTSLNLLYAEQLQSQGELVKALEHIHAFSQAHPDNIDAKLEYALLLVKNGQSTLAEQTLQNIKGKQRTSLVEYYHARALIDMRRPDDAISHLQRAITLQPDFVEAMIELAYLYEQQKNYAQSRALYEKILAQDETNPDVLLRLVALSLRLKQPQRAMEFVLEGMENSAFVTTAAGMFFEAKNYTEAENLLKSVLNNPNPPDEAYFYLAAIAYEVKKNTTEALSWLGKVSKKSQSYLKAAILRAQLHLDNNESAAALDVIKKAQEARPENKELYDMEIRILANNNQKDAALRIAKNAAEHWKNDADMAFMYASLLDETNNKKEALSVMEDIITRNPDHFKALNYVGYTLADENRELDRAIALLQKAVKLSPDSDYILDSLAWAHYRAGQYENAWTAINKAVTINATNDPTIWEHYGDIAAALGKKNEARKGYTKAMEKATGNKQDIKNKLAAYE